MSVFCLLLYISIKSLISWAVIVATLCAALVWFGSHRREWKASVHLSIYLAHKLQFLSLVLHLVFFNEPEQKQRETAGTRSALCFSSIFIFCHQYSYNNVKPLAQARHSACHQYSHLLIVIHITLNCWHQVSDLFVINIHITASS